MTMIKVEIDLDTFITIIVTAIIATAIRIELQGVFMTFICSWLWVMAMAVLLRKLYEHV